MFHNTLDQIDTAGPLPFTRPFFDIAAEGIGSERLDSNDQIVETFFKKWEQFIGEYDADTRCSVLADMLGRFPAALAVNNIDIEGLFKKVLNDGKGTQDPAIAFKLGGHIASNPYAPIIPRFFEKFLTAGTYAELVKGFTSELSKAGYSVLKPKDIKVFLTTTNHLFYKFYKADYFKFVLEIMRSDTPDHLISYFLFPMRNEYLSLIKGMFGELRAQMEGLRMIAEFFERAFEDEGISKEKKKYLYSCFKQIETDLSEGMFSQPASISQEVKDIRDKFHYLEERFRVVSL